MRPTIARKSAPQPAARNVRRGTRVAAMRRHRVWGRPPSRSPARSSHAILIIRAPATPTPIPASAATRTTGGRTLIRIKARISFRTSIRRMTSRPTAPTRSRCTIISLHRSGTPICRSRSPDGCATRSTAMISATSSRATSPLRPRAIMPNPRSAITACTASTRIRISSGRNTSSRPRRLRCGLSTRPRPFPTTIWMPISLRMKTITTRMNMVRSAGAVARG